MLRQFSALIQLNILNLPHRWGGALVTVVGIGCVVGVFMGLFSVAAGYAELMKATGDADTYIVLREGAQSEPLSPLHVDELPHIVDSKFVRHDAEGPLASPEFLWRVELPRIDTGKNVFAGFRGITPAAYRVRENFELLEGRRVSTGLNEILVGRRAHSQFRGLTVGNRLRLMGTEWTVVGVFADNGGMSESELWVDLPMIQDLLPWGQEYHSVRLKMNNSTEVDAFNAELASNPIVLSRAQTEQSYYARFAGDQIKQLSLFSLPLIILMALGAIAAALNTMYSSVAARTKEIATLRSLGFSPLTVMLSTLVEALLLALAGALIAAAVIYAAFNGYTAVTTSGNFLAVQLDFAVTPALIAQGIGCALAVGLIGGIFPAIRAGRMAIATALRES
jgi:putative ABC transport system permease protein